MWHFLFFFSLIILAALGFLLSGPSLVAGTRTISSWRLLLLKMLGSGAWAQ